MKSSIVAEDKALMKANVRRILATAGAVALILIAGSFCSSPSTGSTQTNGVSSTR